MPRRPLAVTASLMVLAACGGGGGSSGPTGSNHLWVSDSSANAVYGFSFAQLAETGAPSPDVGIGTGSPSQTYGSALGPGGALWVALPSANKVARFTAAQLQTSGTPTPATTVAATFPDHVMFDLDGNLWVSRAGGAQEISRFARADVSKNGDLTPTAEYKLSASTGGGSITMLLDPGGHLWVVDKGDGVSLAPTYMREPDTVFTDTGDATPTPEVSITTTGQIYVQGAAFDSTGALWVATLNTGSTQRLNRYSAAQLAASGTVTPAARITVTGGSSLGGIAFDAGGNLWIADFTGRVLLHVPASQLQGSGDYTATPDVVITAPDAAGNGLTGLVVDPSPEGYPLAY
jgi:sugar lactone lactonase YvrE